MDEDLSSSTERLEQGHYYQKQLGCSDRLISWTHRRRFETALDVALSCNCRRVLDFGCGDGTFLALLANRSEDLVEGVGAEVSQADVDDCSRRFRDLDKLKFARIDDLTHRSMVFDTVFVMEVLEHVYDLPSAIDALDHHLEKGGTLVVSVPVEIGLPVVVKQTVRRIAGWRGLSDYKHNSRYSARELFSTIFASNTQHIQRPIYNNGNWRFHDHKGFNWMALRDLLAKRLRLVRVFGSPLTWLPPQLASQAWLIYKKD